MVLYKTVDTKGYGLDRYGRILGVVFVDGKNVNLELEPYLQAEAEAKKAGRGIWLRG